ncbi:hypothetical protein FH608_046690 [Nonomuraea phyllanthi]|uniref:WXG100 family type VII secretion target n=1 Tax=Nonomuraea phyllanthi TaxID=2219224 RepID=A0A5C4V8Z9_9ACTN|nr:hypothetical protein [Nonomuraea phyllanthi]KAB8186977.1 hypothetical protein FH608_046690 [Nonomuraea phyllanthi]
MTIPSQSQLLRQAAEKEVLATTLTRYAEELDRVFAGTLARPQEVDAFWKGPAAGRFTHQAGQLRREIGALRDSCLATADRLRRQAQLVRSEAAQMPS